MAKIEPLLPIIFGWEGGISDENHDNGGLTNMGITLGTWKSCGYDKDGDGDIDASDLRLITKEDVIRVLRVHYWNRFKADEIKSQAVANLCVDWLWNSGSHAIRHVQRILKLTQDGIVGAKTIEAINSVDQEYLFKAIWMERKAFIVNICLEDETQQKFYKGWINRLNSFKWTNEIH